MLIICTANLLGWKKSQSLFFLTPVDELVLRDGTGEPGGVEMMIPAYSRYLYMGSLQFLDFV